jgi:extracellular factor (EF) 3-hydroxypalmitic acid methyl ester biosynthesis protein
MGATHAKNGGVRDSWVVFDHNQGAEVGRLLRFTRHVAVFETYAPSSVLQMSQVLAEFKILLYGQTVYSGRGVIRSLIHAGVAFVVEVTLDGQWLETVRPTAGEGVVGLAGGFTAFLQGWQRVYRVLPEFKVVVADLHAFLSDMRMWMDQRELGLVSDLAGESADVPAGELLAMQEEAVKAIDLLHERFEEIADGVNEESRPVHEHFARRHLHPLFLCSPFGHRAYHKPLGYAGDYLMVDMILRPPCEGPSLFARTMNLWLLRQYPSEAHRNRIDQLVCWLNRETLRRQVQGQTCRVLSLGCGPAHEIQRFIQNGPLADGLDLELLDMNDETLVHVGGVMEELKRRHGRRCSIRTRKRSVLGLLRDASRSTATAAGARYDFIYCAGLFDYLTDGACRQLLKVCWDGLAPGGLLVATNVDRSRPFRNMLEFLLDWHLNYRDRKQMLMLVPTEIPQENQTLSSDATGVNLLLEIRRSGGQVRT